MVTFFNVLQKYGISNKKVMKILLDYPKILSVDIDKTLKETIFLFELYHQIPEKDTIKIFRAFPFLVMTP